MKLTEYAKKINTMSSPESKHKSIGEFYLNLADVNDGLNQKLDYYMDKYGKSLDLINEIMNITNEAYSGKYEMTDIEMANKITDAIHRFGL